MRADLGVTPRGATIRVCAPGATAPAMRGLYEAGRVCRGYCLAVVREHEHAVDDSGDDAEEEHGGNLGPGLLYPCMDADCVVPGLVCGRWAGNETGRTLPRSDVPHPVCC